MQDTLDLRVAPHEPVHVVATASALEGHVKRHRRVVVFCPQRQVPRQTAKPSILSSASARAWVARMINIVQPPRRRAVEPRGQCRVDGVDFHTSSVCPKLGRVPTTHKQSAGAESLLIRRRALNESASVATAEYHYRPVSRSAPWRTCVLSASRSCAVSARQSFHSLYQRSPARADVFAVVLALL